MSLAAYLQLSLVDGLGPLTVRRMIEQAGSVDAALAMRESDLRAVDGIGPGRASRLHRAIGQAASKTQPVMAACRAAGIHLICAQDAQWPVLLNEIPDPPLVLYIKGTIEPRDLNALAIVGARDCSFYGREQAERFGAILAASGFTMVSGGARGIDSAAHRGALSYPDGRTIAVLGCGVDVVYPPENSALFDQIASRGAVVSEFPPGTQPLRQNFPRRNRIVSGMSRGVLVVEADEHSGALITARMAADDHNRPVFALPGRVDNPMSVGPHLLIRSGATLVTQMADILEDLGPLPASVAIASGDTATDISHADETTPPDLLFPQPGSAAPSPADRVAPAALPAGASESQSALLAALAEGEAGVDLLIERTGLSAAEVQRDLTLLSIRGVVARTPAGGFARRRK